MSPDTCQRCTRVAPTGRITRPCTRQRAHGAAASRPVILRRPLQVKAGVVRASRVGTRVVALPRVAVGVLVMLGIVGLAFHAGFGDWLPEWVFVGVMMIPTVPLIALSGLLPSGPVRYGLLWDSVHARGMLTAYGVVAVYFVPAAGLAWWLRRRRGAVGHQSPK